MIDDRSIVIVHDERAVSVLQMSKVHLLVPLWTG
jgi:hypothetical protein